MIGTAIAGAVTPIIGRVLDRVLPDDARRAELETEIARELISSEAELRSAQSEVIIAEASSRFWLVAAWRPILMLTFGAMIVNSYLVSPYVEAMCGCQVASEIPDGIIEIMFTGVTGYIGFRSAEKLAPTIVAGFTAPRGPRDQASK